VKSTWRLDPCLRYSNNVNASPGRQVVAEKLTALQALLVRENDRHQSLSSSDWYLCNSHIRLEHLSFLKTLGSGATCMSQSVN